MSNTLKFGAGKWATGTDTVLAYNDENSNFKPLPFDFTRASTATVVNKLGLIEDVASGTPRIDFLGNTKGALLLEPQRSNLITYSEAFDNAAWTKSGTTIVDNAIASPDGYVNAAKLVENSANAGHYMYVAATFAVGNYYTYSVFAKKGGTDYLQLLMSSNSFSITAYANFDLLNGVVGTVGANTTAKIEALANDWYRLSTTYLCGTSGTQNSSLFLADSSTMARAGSYLGNGTNGAYLYGAQYEAGSYSTSLINTSGTAVTRVAETCSQTVPSGIIGQTEGTIFVEANLSNIIDPTNLRGILEINDGTTSNRFSIYRGANDLSLSVIVFTAAAAVANIAASTISGQIKIAVAYNSSDVTVYINGSLIGTDTSVTIPACSDLDLGIVTTNTTRILGDGINQALIFKTRLTNAELATLTTL